MGQIPKVWNEKCHNVAYASGPHEAVVEPHDLDINGAHGEVVMIHQNETGCRYGGPRTTKGLGEHEQPGQELVPQFRSQLSAPPGTPGGA